MAHWTAEAPDHRDVAEFVPGPGIARLQQPRVDLELLRTALTEVLQRLDYDDTNGKWGFGVLPVTRRPGTDGRAPVDLSGRFWIRPDDSYVEIPREDLVDEAGYTEIGLYHPNHESQMDAFEHIAREVIPTLREQR